MDEGRLAREDVVLVSQDILAGFYGIAGRGI